MKNNGTIAKLMTLLKPKSDEHSVAETSLAEPLQESIEIDLGNEKEIANLVKILEDPATNYKQRLDVAKALIERDLGNQKAISALTIILENPDVDDTLSLDLVHFFTQIDINQNKRAIAAFLTFFNNICGIPYTYGIQRCALQPVLARIEPGNEIWIEELVEIFSNPNTHHKMYWQLRFTLSYIAIGNERAISKLIVLLSKPDPNGYLHYFVKEILGKIAVGNEKGIAKLRSILSDPNLDEDLRGYVAKVLGRAGEIEPPDYNIQ